MTDMRKNLDEIRAGIALCQKVGAQTPNWVQGGGGNVSWKDTLDSGAPVLFIKASGWRLDGVSEQGGLAAVYLEEFGKRMAGIPESGDHRETQYAQAISGSSLAGDGAGSVGLKPGIMLSRPSMETGFHALLPRRFVLHFHALSSLLLFEDHTHNAAMIDEALAREGFEHVRWIPATMPGLELSRAVGAHPNTQAFILQNHGVILHGDDTMILDRWRRFESTWLGAHRLSDLSADNGTALMAEKALQTPTPLRFYFPDTAVFYDKLHRCLKVCNSKESPDGIPRYVLAREHRSNLDMAELWAATVALFAARPKLAQLPSSILENVAGLPTEQFRRG